MCILRALRRRRLRRQPFPETWLKILEEQVPFFGALPAAKRQRFLTDLRIFIEEKHFIPAGGMEITDEVKVVVAACAVRLIMYRDLSYLDRLTEMVIYPYDYRHADMDGMVFGEAHDWGTVVLSWPAVQRGVADPRDGHETAAHEFAHVLDRADGAFDGTPVLDRMRAYGPWARVMSEHFERLQRRGPRVRKVLRPYGETNEAEFFAVATESYFEKPVQMKKQTPELYQKMQSFYGGDPAALAERAAPDSDDDPWHDVGRNEPCPCGSGKKFKRCCGR